MSTHNTEKNKHRYLVTGGCGFIGSHFVSHLLQSHEEACVINIDSMTYAAHPQTAQYLEAIAPGRYQHYERDIADPKLADLISKLDIGTIINFAAESHVDRSILDPSAFIRTNISGVQNLLTIARNLENVRFVQVSTDEVYGSLEPEDPTFTENSPLAPSSPYAASKASADLLVQAAYRTFGQDVVITRCSNNYGPFQFPEKLIPLVIANALEDKPIPVYGDGKQVRDWIYTEDHCKAIAVVMKSGKSGRVYNISGNEEKANIELIQSILKLLNKDNSLIEYVADRPGHDRRYGLNATRLKDELGWEPTTKFEDGLRHTIEWYQENKKWWTSVRNKDYQNYYRANYAHKFQSRVNP